MCRAAPRHACLHRRRALDANGGARASGGPLPRARVAHALQHREPLHVYTVQLLHGRLHHGRREAHPVHPPRTVWQHHDLGVLVLCHGGVHRALQRHGGELPTEFAAGGKVQRLGAAAHLEEGAPAGEFEDADFAEPDQRGGRRPARLQHRGMHDRPGDHPRDVAAPHRGPGGHGVARGHGLRPRTAQEAFRQDRQGRQRHRGDKRAVHRNCRLAPRAVR
mmetsp:Transcript_124996/g.358873  ORF Transcript_124996/g.358873 Transcript_124996/m.358873 type:complete len:220 (-) Transcript_124996:322-981(-)